MKRTLNYSALERYCRAFSEQVLSEAYAHQHRVDGPGILSISPVKQVNFLVIRALFDHWQQEMDRLKSPYFDYQHEEVQVALEEFMNTLSQHMAVAQADLQPLLEEAVQDTLLLVLSPAAYYRQALDRRDEQQWYAEDVKAWAKYVKIHREPLEELSERVAATDGVGISSEEARRLVEEAASALAPEDPSGYLADFSSVAPVSEEELLEVTEAPSPPSPEPAPVEEAPEPEPVEEVPSSRTLNDELTGGQGATLADLHRQQKIENIKSYIGVNQRFMFIRELFDNNADEYNQALDELEQKNTYIEAFNHLRQAYAQPHRWKMDSEEVVEFLEIVAKRF